MTQAGILPDEVGFTSDHAGLFIDVAPAILETKNSPIPPVKQRKLKCYNRPNVQKYIKYVLEQFESHNIVQRIQKLKKQINEEGFTEEAGMQLNKLDKHVTEIMLRSENKLCPDETPFEYSAELERQMRIVCPIKRLKEQAHKNFHLKLILIKSSRT